MTVTNNYEIEFDGIKICDGINTLIMDFDPFSSPAIRSSDKARGQDDGMFPGLDLLGARTITLSIEVFAEDQDDFFNVYSPLVAACRKTNEDKVLAFKIPGWPDVLTVNARVRRFQGLNINTAFDLGGPVVVQVQFVAVDPRIYASTEQSATVGIVGVQTGRTYNLAFNRTFGGLVASNIITAANSGNYDAPWTARIDGPVTNPSIEHVGLGKTLELNASIGTGEFLIISSSPYKTIMLGGTATRYQWLIDSTKWFLLEPGNNSIRFNGSSAGSPTMTFTWRSAWA